ncbi:MAG TPA: PDZ domain-containing protein [Gemmatimonadaceae bacterium]|nr:PDZ domain-containing protein [Gemmatimonadaceae bacterium]
MSRLRLAAALAALGAAAAPAAAQRQTVSATSAVSAPISDVRYEVAFDTASASSRMLRVTMTFATSGSAPVVLSLPAWTPGAYEMSWFAKWVSNFAATGDGRELQWDKVDFDTWRVRPNGAKRVTVKFDFLADSLDNAMAWTRPDFALFNGTNVFMYPEGRGFEWPATVTVRTQPTWFVATGMTPAAGGTTGGAGTRSFTARNYHDLVDMPFFVGAFDLDSARVGGVWARLATYPKGFVAGRNRTDAWSFIQRALPPEIAVFGEAPFSTYTVMQIADSSFGGASGLEHQNSHVDVISPYAIGNPFMPSLYAHEIFHAWNVKRLRPADMVPYRYDQPQPTTWLWVSEGITDYYADLALVRGGIVDSTGFIETTSGKITEVGDALPVALEDASLSTWIHPTDGTGYLYYPKGSLAGFMLDIMIRDATDNRRSLDDVMRELYTTTYKRGRGFTGAEWWGAVSRAAGGRSFTDFEAKYIDGREPYPWATLLPLAGMRFLTDTIREPRLGVFTQVDSAGVRITSVSEGGAAAAAGVRTGDILVSVGDIKVADANFGDNFRAKYLSAAEGSALPIQIRRGGQTLNLSGALRFAFRTQSRVSIDPNASPKAARIRAGILHGTTDR